MVTVPQSTVQNTFRGQSLPAGYKNENGNGLHAPPALEFSFTPLYILLGLWVVCVGINFATGRHFRFELALALWFIGNLLFLGSGKGMYETFLFLVLPAVLLGVTDLFPVGPVTVEMAYLIPALNLIPYCWSGALKRGFPERNQANRANRLGPYLALFVFACIGSAFQGVVIYPTQALRATGVIFIIPFFFYLYTSHAIQRLANVKEIARLIVMITAFYSALMGIIQIAHRGHFARIARNLVLFPEEKIELMWKFTFGEGKVISVWPDAASFGHVLCFSFPLAFGLALTARTTRERIDSILATLLISIGIMITGNRTDILGAFTTVIFLILGFWTRSATVRGIIFKVGMIAIIAALVIISTRENNGLTRLFMPGDWDKKTASSRTILIGEGIRMFESSPMLGIGLDNFRFNQDYRKDGLYIVENYAHNLFVQILAETGIIGLCFFLLLMIQVFRFARITWRHRTDTELDFFCYLFLVSCVVLVLQGLIENALFYVQTASLFWAGVGIWRGRALEKKHAERQF
ncbi:MAG: hypothetical protein AMXMBFR75_08590 [Candidatus Hinthialibacteria bacterium]|nr:MAG: O-Antigen ligase [Candidatus Hinthialibacteria bacterium OLB16]